MKTSVSTYSYRTAYCRGLMGMKDIVEAVSLAGADGIELLGELTPVGSFPNPTDRQVSEWACWMEEYRLTPTCMDSAIVPVIYKNRASTLKEQLDMIERDLIYSKRLGFSMIRVPGVLMLNVIEQSVSIAEYHGVKLAFEIHAPRTVKCKFIQDYIEMIERTGTEYAGLLPDFSMYSIAPSYEDVRLALHRGAKREHLDFIVGSFADGVAGEVILDELMRRGAGEVETGMVRRFAGHRVYESPEELRSIAKYIFNIHAKSYYTDENFEEKSHDHLGPIQVLKDIGYTGYIATEYEGSGAYSFQNTPDEPDEVEQVCRHQEMLRRLISADDRN